MNRNVEKGLGLIEVLIALVVFALGVVGMAGLHLRTLSMSMDSVQRSVVIAKSQDVADRIRSSGAPPGSYVGTYASAACAVVPAVSCADSELGLAENCSAAQMATFDVWEAFCGSDSGLEGGVIEWVARITCDSGCTGAGARMAITTQWVSRTNDTDASVADNNITNIDGSRVSTLTDQMTLRFVR